MLELNGTRKFTTVRRGTRITVIRHDTNHLQKYADLCLYGWTEKKILTEMHEDFKTELERVFPDEPALDIEHAAQFIMLCAERNLRYPTLDSLTETEPAPVPKNAAHWVTVYDKGLGYHKECPICGARWMLDSQEHVCKETPFCHNCGTNLTKEPE